MKGYEMKKLYTALAVGCISLYANNLMAAEYDDCLAKAMNDSEIAMCNNSETARIMRRIQSRYKALSSRSNLSATVPPAPATAGRSPRTGGE